MSSRGNPEGELPESGERTGLLGPAPYQIRPACPPLLAPQTISLAQSTGSVVRYDVLPEYWHISCVSGNVTVYQLPNYSGFAFPLPAGWTLCLPNIGREFSVMADGTGAAVVVAVAVSGVDFRYGSHI